MWIASLLRLCKSDNPERDYRSSTPGYRSSGEMAGRLLGSKRDAFGMPGKSKEDMNDLWFIIRYNMEIWMMVSAMLFVAVMYWIPE